MGLDVNGGNLMTAHQYLLNVLDSQQLQDVDINPMRQQRDQIESNLRSSFGSIPRFYYGGSFGKKTMIKLSYDLDIVIYFPSTERYSLRNIYNSAHQALKNAGYMVEPKNVALRLLYQAGFHIDVVPGKAQDDKFLYATLYKSVEDTTMQTSIKVHIDSIRDVRNVVTLMKIWKIRQRLELKTFVIEQIVNRALYGKQKTDYGTCIWNTLEYIRDNINTIRLIYPANSNNIIDIPSHIRSNAYYTAVRSLSASKWEQIIW
jgi:hypothetical protein